MPLIFKAFQSQLPTKDGKFLYYPRLVKMGTVETPEIAKKISWATSLTPGDVQNVIYNLTEVMKEHLMNSMSVKLDGLGTFTMMTRANGKGVENAEDVSSSQITGLRCQFTPEYSRNYGTGITRALTDNVSYVSLASLGVMGAPAGNNPGDGGGDNPGDPGWVDPSV